MTQGLRRPGRRPGGRRRLSRAWAGRRRPGAGSVPPRPAARRRGTYRGGRGCWRYWLRGERGLLRSSRQLLSPGDAGERPGRWAGALRVSPLRRAPLPGLSASFPLQAPPAERRFVSPAMASVPSAGCLLAKNQYYRSECSGRGPGAAAGAGAGGSSGPSRGDVLVVLTFGEVRKVMSG